MMDEKKKFQSKSYFISNDQYDSTVFIASNANSVTGFDRLVDFDEWNIQYNQCSIKMNQKMSLYHKVFAHLSHHTVYLLNPSELVLKSPQK